MKKTQFVMLLFLLGGFMSYTIFYEKKSPPAKAEGNVGGAAISIAYSSPSVKGRKIWGELVPYGKAWRAGANEATTFTTDKDITVEGKSLKAGKYSLSLYRVKKNGNLSSIQKLASGALRRVAMRTLMQQRMPSPLK